jgi:hypothetical protein
MSRRLRAVQKKLTETKVIDKHLDEAQADLHGFMREDCELSEQEIKDRRKFENLDQFVEDQVAKRNAMDI